MRSVYQALRVFNCRLLVHNYASTFHNLTIANTWPCSIRRLNVFIIVMTRLPVQICLVPLDRLISPHVVCLRVCDHNKKKTFTVSKRLLAVDRFRDPVRFVHLHTRYSFLACTRVLYRIYYALSKYPIYYEAWCNASVCLPHYCQYRFRKKLQKFEKIASIIL